MKHKTGWIIALVAMPLLAAASVVHARTAADEEAEFARWEAFMAELQKTLDATEIDFQFTITDPDGKPLDGVSVEIEKTRPDLHLLMSGGAETKKEKKTVDSKFRIQEKGWTGLELTFLKDGYYIENRNYLNDSFLNTMSRYPGPDDKSKLVMKEDIQIVMYKGVPAADLTGTRGTLRYDFEKGTRSIFDLSAFDKKTEKTKKTTVSEEDGEEEEEEDEEEYVEERIRIEMKSVDLKAKPKASKYVELDFRRDDKGEVLFDGMLRDTPCPASFIIRLHSDDPGDGFIAVDKLGPGFVRWEEYEKRYPTAPETGYKKELVLDFGKKDADGKFPYKTNYLFAFVKCGQHYGTVCFRPIVIDGGPNKTIRQFRLGVESLNMNRTAGDRNVSEGIFYVEQPVIKRYVPDKKEAKNEAENAPEDKAETAKKMITLLGSALQQYKLDVGTYPSSLRCLEKNFDNDSRWDGPYIRPNVPLDPWGNEYRYSVDGNGKAYRLSSSGLPE